MKFLLATTSSMYRPVGLADKRVIAIKLSRSDKGRFLQVHETFIAWLARQRPHQVPDVDTVTEKSHVSWICKSIYMYCHNTKWLIQNSFTAVLAAIVPDRHGHVVGHEYLTRVHYVRAESSVLNLFSRGAAWSDHATIGVRVTTQVVVQAPLAAPPGVGTHWAPAKMQK